MCDIIAEYYGIERATVVTTENSDGSFTSTTAEQIRWKKPTSSLVCKKKRQTSLKKKERKNKKGRVVFIPSAWLGARKAFQPTTLCVYSIL